MRVIAGTAKGHHLKEPASSVTRPTADKIKGALFAMLDSLYGVVDARVLDLYAGTGALGIEALSRGAAWADFVEENRAACAVIRENLARTRLAERAAVHCMTVRSALSVPHFTQGRAYDIILLDPPYADPDIGRIMEMTADSGLVADGAIVVLEHARRFAVRESYGRLRLLKTRCHGDTCLSLFSPAASSADSAASGDDTYTRTAA